MSSNSNVPFASNLTHEEYYNLHGNLPVDRIESLIVDSGAVEAFQEDIGTIRDTASEIIAQLPAEDFLEGILTHVRNIVKCKGVANQREMLSDLLENIQEIQDQQNQSSEYARDEFKKIDIIYQGNS
jgi:hypothetical protein